MNRVLIRVLLPVTLLCGVATAAVRKAEWKIGNISLTPQRQWSAQKLNVAVLPVSRKSTRRRFELSANVPLTHVNEYFVSGSRLVVFGDADRVQAVVIFDLLHRKKLDWFLCYEPHRVSENWIVYREWYPSHATGTPMDVVLLYDIDKSPAENRMNKSDPIPRLDTDSPVRVGVPIYPPSNAEEKSYDNLSQEGQQGEMHVVEGHSFAKLNDHRLVFVGGEGHDASDMRNFLVVVDFRKGLSSPEYTQLEVPMDQWKPPSWVSPHFVQVLGIQPISNSKVRLLVPPDQKGIDSIVMEIPRS
jgi:hypothetical protein